MKKTLLTLAAVAMTVGAWAQRPTEEAQMIPSDYIDVTPDYYKFYKGTADLDEMVRTFRLAVAFHLGNGDNPNWVTNNYNGNGEDYFSPTQVTNGNWLIGGWVMNNNKQAEFKEGVSLYDFGGNIGSAMVINYSNSKLNEAIQEACDVKNVDIPVVGVDVAGNICYFALSDFQAMNDYVLLANPDLTAEDLLAQAEDVEIKPIRIHVRLVLNAYNNDMATLNVPFDSTSFGNELGNYFGSVDAMDGYVDITQFAEDGKWSPKGWMVRDYEFNYAGVAGGIKFNAQGIDGSFYNQGAFLIRSIEFYVVPEDAEQLPNIEGKNYSAYYDTWWDSTKGSIDRSDAVEPSYPENLYVMGNIVGNAWDPTKAVAPVSAENGVFTFTDIELYNTETDPSYFTFINTLTSDWNVINDGTHRYGPAEGQNSAIEAGQSNIKFSLGGDTSFNIANGIYDFVVDFNTMTLSVAESGSDGVNSVIDLNAPVEFYNLNGVKVANPENGVFIRKQGNTTSKVIIR